MKPKEFDELVRHKFDQSDFAYSPRNWDKLAEELDGRAKKRSTMMWLWMPALGIAASVAMAVGVTGMLRFGAPAGAGTGAEYAQANTFVLQPGGAAAVTAVRQQDIKPQQQGVRTAPAARHIPAAKAQQPIADNDGVGISMKNILGNNTATRRPDNELNLAAAPHTTAPAATVAAKPKKKPVDLSPGYNTFIKEEVLAAAKPARLSVILSGGINQGSHISGYMAGASVRRMISDKLYVEGDIAFASSDNTQSIQYQANPAAGTGGGVSGGLAKPAGSAAKLSKVESNTSAVPVVEEPIIKTKDVSYNLYYAQVTPTIGYKIIKKLSVGVGPDFQKVLVDNRPEQSTAYRGNIQVAPLFDVGFIGKTEYALTSKVKAAVSYRKGINGVITPSDKYIDRDYLQFQVKCTIFNK